MKDAYREALVRADVNVSDAVNRCCGREDLFERLLKLFLKNENEVSLIQERVESGQYENLFSQMHALKGAAGGIGLTNLYQALYTLVEDLRVEKYDDVADKTEVVINEYMKIREIVKLYADESTENRG